jgi:hypothetical protein
MNYEDAMFRCLADKIPHLHQPASGTVSTVSPKARPPEGDPAAAGLAEIPRKDRQAAGVPEAVTPAPAAEATINPGPTGTLDGDRTRPTAAGPNAAGTDDELGDLVTLDQCAAMVNRSKRTLENYKKTMPRPKVLGGGGKPHEYAWSEMRPWLEKRFGRSLPVTYPGRPKAGKPAD